MTKRHSGRSTNRVLWFLFVLVSLLLVAVVVAAQEPDQASAAADVTVCAGPCTYNSIQAAINGVAPGTRLLVAGEVFNETITVDKSLTIQGAGAGSTIVQAAASPGVATRRVVTVTEGVSVTLDGLTIRFGNTSGVGNDARGGGILNEGTLTLAR
ncbi:hypothetical protein ACFLWA_12955, partial [Chloroflexota bacterium]